VKGHIEGQCEGGWLSDPTVLAWARLVPAWWTAGGVSAEAGVAIVCYKDVDSGSTGLAWMMLVLAWWTAGAVSAEAGVAIVGCKGADSTAFIYPGISTNIQTSFGAELTLAIWSSESLIRG
jgi:hypothetical protein